MKPVGRNMSDLIVELVDYRNRTVTTLVVPGPRNWNERKASRASWERVFRWREEGAVGFVARDETGKVIAYG